MSECKIESDGRDLFVVCDGKRIAKRGQPGTAHAKTWISIEPGYVVHDEKNGRELVVERRPVTRQ
jgi:hypothetical protein